MKVLVSDFDKTFYDDNYLNNIDIVNKFVKSGNMFIIATGRSFDRLNEVIKVSDIAYSYLICNDGMNIYDNANNNIFSCSINKETLTSLYKLLESDKNIIGILLESSKDEYSSQINSIAGKFINRDICCKLVEKINEQFDDVYAYLSEYHINIRNKSASKANAIKFLIDNYNLNKEDIYTIGDGVNDSDMCECFKSFSFVNADQTVKDVSKIIVNNFKEAIDNLKKVK
ncbi:MAG: HAD-IIB family hydrolase [Bacilli bacterium]|nr:HAD-IIB family hydrolase [Bacilli bacterium]MCI9434885.1 HAD-IIB family hydrolase [Bacilli bacterium]